MSANDMIDIDSLIKRSKYSDVEIDDATSGLCGMFALALSEFLNERGITASLVVFADSERSVGFKGKYGQNTSMWSHVAVKVENSIFDIRGKVNPQDIHREFHTDIIIPISKRTLMLDIREIGGWHEFHYSRKRRNYYKSSLTTSS